MDVFKHRGEYISQNQRRVQGSRKYMIIDIDRKYIDLSRWRDLQQ